MIKFLLPILSALFLILSFPVINFEIFVWFAFLPLFFVIKDKKPIHAFLQSYLCGLIFFAGTIYWLINVTFIGFLILILYLALYFGIFGFIFSFTRSRLNPLMSLFFIPSVWVLLEYVRSHLFTGFGWALLGYSQYLNLAIIQIASITGVWGVSFLIMLINVFIYKTISYRLKVRLEKQILPFSTTFYLLPFLLLFLSIGYGFYKLQGIGQEGAPFRISVVQANIPQAIKWEEGAKDKILGEYLHLSGISALDKPDLIIWPEAALPEILEQQIYFKDNLKEFLYNTKIPLLLGAVILEGDNYYNSAILVSRKGRLIQRYDKIHLVPFGEYIPFKNIFPFLQTIVPIGDFSAGREYTVFLHEKENPRPDIQFQFAKQPIYSSVLICFEDIFPEISRCFIKKGADFLINITNDAWFGDTSSPYQHLQASVFRAIENSVYLVRAANTGISAFITPRGEIYPFFDSDSGRQTFVSGYMTREIYPSLRQNSLYTQWGDWLVLVCLIISIYGVTRFKK